MGNQPDDNQKPNPSYILTLSLTLLIFFLLLGVGELLARTTFFRSHFIPISRGTTHQQFEFQLGRLEMITALSGPVDCLLLGNSMVWRGFDPLVSGSAFQEQTGRDLRCFNFGVDALPVSTASVLAEYLIREYRPKLLIYGTDARDFSVARNDKDTTVLLDSPWIRYQMGEFNLLGWLYEKSYLYRYLETLANLLRLEKQWLFVNSPEALNSDSYGFTGDTDVGTFVSTPPHQNVHMGPVRYLFEMLSDYRMLPENLEAFDKLISSGTETTSIALVVLPVPDMYMEFFTRKDQDYQMYLDKIRRSAELAHVTVWETPTYNVIPPDGWVDYSHLNIKGAHAFSRWLGERLAEAAITGQLAGLDQ
jgi:hypothetical protein